MIVGNLGKGAKLKNATILFPLLTNSALIVFFSFSLLAFDYIKLARILIVED